MKLFVAKLNRETTEAELTENFSQFGGVVSVKVVTDRDTGQSKCFGFIEMATMEAGEAAIAGQNGQEFMGFRMVVKEAEDKPRAPRPSFGANSGGKPGDASSRGSFSKDGGSAPGSFDNKGDLKKSGNFSTTINKKRTPSKKPKGGPDKYADGPRTVVHSKRPKSNRNQWLDDLDDF
ncbi:MAG: RNA-binding protein [Crocinitomicaceae bacterium]|nr:RNA-binding protein [Crocinitomicaceae bacterium]